MVTPPSPVSTASSSQGPAAPRLTRATPIRRTPQVPAATIATAPAPQAVRPDSFTLFTSTPTTLSAPYILSTLASGRAFPADVEQAIVAATGHTITAAGLETLFAPLLPHATWVVSDPQLDANKVASFIIAAIDRRGRIVFENGIEFPLGTAAGLEVHNFGASVDPRYRGLGITAAAEVLQGAILAAISSHPNTRLTLSAHSATDANTGMPQLGNGAFVHASRGYMFADSVGLASTSGGYDASPLADPLDNEATIMFKHFANWLGHEPGILLQGIAASAACRAELLTMAKNAKQPWDYLNLHLPDCTAPGFTGEGAHVPMPVGKAFLLSGETPEWCGLRFVNELPANTQEPQQAWRLLSQNLFATQVRRETQSAGKVIEQRTQQAWTGLASPDPQVRAAAYREVGQYGHPGLAPLLDETLYGARRTGLFKLRREPPRETDLEARKALREALRLMDGRLMRSGLRAAATNPSLPYNTRQAMVLRCSALGISVR